jgi:hypothetical protein
VNNPNTGLQSFSHHVIKNAVTYLTAYPFSKRFTIIVPYSYNRFVDGCISLPHVTYTLLPEVDVLVAFQCYNMPTIDDMWYYMEESYMIK